MALTKNGEFDYEEDPFRPSWFPDIPANSGDGYEEVVNTKIPVVGKVILAVTIVGKAFDYFKSKKK